MHSKNYEKLLQYALKLIAKKRYTVAEMQKKLERFLVKISDTQGDTVKLVIARLKELKYLDDEKYAINYISDRAKFRPRGVFLIKGELKRKGLNEKLINEVISLAVSSEELDEVAMAEQLLQKKIKSWSKFEPRKIKEKSFGFLSSKGFKPDTIYKAVNRCYDPNAIEDL